MHLLVGRKGGGNLEAACSLFFFYALRFVQFTAVVRSRYKSVKRCFGSASSSCVVDRLLAVESLRLRFVPLTAGEGDEAPLRRCRVFQT